VLLFEKVRPAIVPAFVGRSLAECESLARAASLGLTIGRRLPDVNARSETVAAQSPQPATDVLPGSQVTIDVKCPGVQVPTLVQQSPDYARTILSKGGLALGAVSYGSSPSVKSGSILSQTPAAGAVVERGTEVIVTVSTGPELVAVPDVSDMEQSAAEAALRAARLSPSVTFLGGDAGPYVVRQQNPKVNTTVPVGSTVTIYVMGTIR
jgi:serine/threonine-protein kinase